MLINLPLLTLLLVVAGILWWCGLWTSAVSFLAVLAAGGVPVLLPPPGPETDVPAHRLATLARAHLRAIDGLILTGGEASDYTGAEPPSQRV
jgi:hypothetical protein